MYWSCTDPVYYKFNNDGYKTAITPDDSGEEISKSIGLPFVGEKPGPGELSDSDPEPDPDSSDVEKSVTSDP